MNIEVSKVEIKMKELKKKRERKKAIIPAHIASH
jgi:hypothetical protein